MCFLRDGLDGLIGITFSFFTNRRESLIVNFTGVDGGLVASHWPSWES